MSATKQYTIWCENCEKWHQISCATASIARRELREHGWSSKRADGKVLDYCPACTQVTQMYRRRKR